VIYAGVKGYLDKLPVNQVGPFEKGLLTHLRTNAKAVLDELRDKDNKVAGELEAKIKGAIEDFARTFA